MRYGGEVGALVESSLRQSNLPSSQDDQNVSTQQRKYDEEEDEGGGRIAGIRHRSS